MHTLEFVVDIFEVEKSTTTRNIVFLEFCFPHWSGLGLELKRQSAHKHLKFCGKHAYLFIRFLKSKVMYSI